MMMGSVTPMIPPFAMRTVKIFRSAIYPVAEKNLLKIIKSNKHVTLQLINNRGKTHGDVTLSASTMEPEVKNSLGGRWWSNSQAAKKTAEFFAKKLHEIGMLKITFERLNQPRGKQTYCGKTKVIIDTLRANGIFFVQMAHMPGSEPTVPEPGAKPMQSDAFRRSQAKLLRAETGYPRDTCVEALQAHGDDITKAATWLKTQVWLPKAKEQ